MESLLSPKVCTALASSYYCFDDLIYDLSHCASEAHEVSCLVDFPAAAADVPVCVGDNGCIREASDEGFPRKESVSRWSAQERLTIHSRSRSFLLVFIHLQRKHIIVGR